MGTGGQSSRTDRGAEKACWPSFLRAESAGQLFGRMLESDPLRLREASARRLRQLWWLLEPERVFRRAAAVCADAACCEAAPGDLEAWAAAKVDLACEQLVREDRDAERTRPDTLTEEESSFPLLTVCLMLEPGLVRAASVAFNALDPLPRRAFFELMIEGREPASVIESGPWDEDALYQAIQTALATLSLDAPADPEDSRVRRSDP